MAGLAKFIEDVRRRRVLSNAALYIVAAWVAIQVADVAIDAGIIRWALRDIFVAAFLGFPVALIVSWFYDITRRGIVRTPPASTDASFDESLHQRDYVLFLLLTVVWVAGVYYIHTPAPVDKSIAILPFENLGNDPNNAIFADGMRVDLQTQLQNLHDLKIIARESTDRIDQGTSLPEMGLRLGAAYILKGSVERVLDKVRISVSLIDAESEGRTWSSSFDRDLTASNWFDIRDEISGAVTEELRAVLSPAERQRLLAVPTDNWPAHQAYLRGTQRKAKRTVGSLKEAIGYFEQAIELDPKHALAYVGLADSHYLHALYARTGDGELSGNMEAAIARALELNDQSGEAHTSLANLQRLAGDPAAAEKSFKRALELNPNYATAHQWYGSFLVSTGRSEEGLTQKRMAQVLSPLSAIISHDVAMTLEGLGRDDEAIAQWLAVIEMDPAFPNPYEGIGRLYWEALARLDEAVVWNRKSVALDPEQASAPTWLAMIYLDLGDPDRAEFWFRRSLELAPNPYWLNASSEILHYYRGEAAEAVKYGHEVLKMDPGSVYTLAQLRNQDLKAGRHAEARARYERAYPELLQDAEPNVDDSNTNAAVDLALVLAGTGEQKRADMLLDRTLAFLRASREKPDDHEILDVLIYALQDKDDKAIAALTYIIDKGWRAQSWFYLERDPNLDSIRDEPVFQATLKEFKAGMAAQLERVRAMDADGELEPIPDID